MSSSNRSPSNQSLFVTLEGIEGCGKTTQAKALSASLEALGHEVLITREPGGTKITEQIRALLADPDSELDPSAELFLFLADRAQHVASVIRPALERGAVVLCDRYCDSTLAYQGYGRGHDLARLTTLNSWASADLEPDLTLWIDCDVEVGLRRARKGAGGPGDRFEAEPLAFHTRIRDGFVALHAAHPERIRRIDGNLPEREVGAAIAREVAARLA